MTKIGVIVGRFQVPQLHAGHKAIIQEVASKNDEVIVIVGDNPLPTTANNPLPAESRIDMVANYLDLIGYEEYAVASLQDHPNDDVWSKNLDDVIWFYAGYDEGGPKLKEITLYHSRDSFAQYYSGIYPTQHVEAVDITSGTEERAKIKEMLPHSEDFRKGVIWANQHRFPTVYSCVDAAVIKWVREPNGLGTSKHSPEVLLITKDINVGYQFPGGFAEVDSTDEEDCMREVLEETGVICENPVYLGSYTQDDWRYRSEIDQIRTRLYVCDYVSGEPTGMDDAATAQWVPIEELCVEDFNKCHHQLAITMFDEFGVAPIPKTPHTFSEAQRKLIKKMMQEGRSVIGDPRRAL